MRGITKAPRNVSSPPETRSAICRQCVATSTSLCASCERPPAPWLQGRLDNGGPERRNELGPVIASDAWAVPPVPSALPESKDKDECRMQQELQEPPMPAALLFYSLLSLLRRVPGLSCPTSPWLCDSSRRCCTNLASGTPG